MRMRAHLRTRLCTVVVAVAAVVALGLPATAHGVTRLEQSDGVVHAYANVELRLVGETLWVTSPDRRGALEIAGGACSFTGGLQRCLPYALTLHQAGRTHAIGIDRGTVYVNLTPVTLALRRSSELLAPRGVLVAVHTVHGTSISIRGMLDAVKP